MQGYWPARSVEFLEVRRRQGDKPGVKRAGKGDKTGVKRVNLNRR